jgi:hypothetical protein
VLADSCDVIRPFADFLRDTERSIVR